MNPIYASPMKCNTQWVSYIWYLRPKPTKRGSADFQMCITFYLLEICPTMYTLRESWDSEDFEKIKIFTFLMLFCNQNDLGTKIWVLAKLVDENIFYGRNQKTPYELVRFFSERGLNMFFQYQMIFGRYSAGKNKFGQFCWCMLENFFSKIDFFRFFKKWSRMDVNIKYWLEMCFEHFGGLFGTISEHLWWPDSPLKKFDFLKKMHFLRFFGIFDFGRFGYKKASKMSNFWKFFKYALFIFRRCL